MSDTISVINSDTKSVTYYSLHEDEPRKSNIAKIMDFDNSYTCLGKWSFP